MSRATSKIILAEAAASPLMKAMDVAFNKNIGPRCDPATPAEYRVKMARNTAVEGQTGSTGQMIDAACPCCAEPHFLKYPVGRAREAMRQHTTCSHCNRTLSREFVSMTALSDFTYVWLIHSGPDVPPYLADQIFARSTFKIFET